ncbi:MAG: M20/M25/M40 family metallo-hydrolase [Microbacteriaceae bacterium]|nr:M20/M25/M40 family metallo-hydrolase [Microbacteriaceae bacterium]
MGRLAALIRVPTVSRADASETDWSAFARFREVLAEQFPIVHASLDRELVAEHTLLYRWRGRDASLPPLILMAHQDVVDPGDVASWEHDPFGAEITGDWSAGLATAVLHGRGTIDDKGSLAAILEATETLLVARHQPARDVWLVFGHDEETHGTGARAAAALLASRGVAPLLVLDEGGAIVEDALPGAQGQLGVIGITEKGVGNVRLRVAEQGGHSSTPPAMSAIGRLARAIARIDAKPFPARLTAAARRMFAAAGRRTPGLRGFLYRNVAWTAPLLRAALVRGGAETAAMVRTTRVATTINGGHAQNAIPERAEATVNVRILPGESLESVRARLVSVVDDPLVTVELDGWEPAPISPTDGPGWELLVSTLRDVRPDVLPVPYGQTGATDSRSFTGLTSAVYRFAPFHLTIAERAALHAIGEQIRLKSWLEGVEFYAELLRRA